MTVRRGQTFVKKSTARLTLPPPRQDRNKSSSLNHDTLTNAQAHKMPRHHNSPPREQETVPRWGESDRKKFNQLVEDGKIDINNTTPRTIKEIHQLHFPEPTTGPKRLLCSPTTCEAEEEVCLNLVCLFSCCCGRDTNPNAIPTLASSAPPQLPLPPLPTTRTTTTLATTTIKTTRCHQRSPPPLPPLPRTQQLPRRVAVVTWTTSPNASRARG